MLPALIVGGVAATYLHKRFPKATEAMADGVVKGTAWLAKKTAELAERRVAVAPVVAVATGCGKCSEYFAVHTQAPACCYCGARRPV